MILDTAHLDALKAWIGESTSVRELLELFRRDAGTRCLAIADALARGELAPVARTAHMLAGSAGNIGALRLHACCLELEEDAVAGDLERSRARFCRVAEEAACADAELARYAA